MNRPLVSIITVAYNSEGTIGKTIESVLNQTYPRIEYLIIDGASRDKTVVVAQSYRECFDKKGYRYRIVSEPDRGIYDAMNKGIRLAEGEIIGLINSDDWYEPDAVAMSAYTMLKTESDITFGQILLHKKNGRTMLKRAQTTGLETSRHWNHPTMFVRTKVYRAFPFPCKGIHDDYTVYLSMKKAGKKITVIPKVLAHFQTGGESNEKSLKKAVCRIRDRYRCYRDNGYSRLYIVECILMETAKLILS